MVPELLMTPPLLVTESPDGMVTAIPADEIITLSHGLIGFGGTMAFCHVAGLLQFPLDRALYVLILVHDNACTS
jgi:hypothetical protein